jgi:hypothetical protein
VQQKTGAELWVPEHRDLAAELALGGGHMSLLTKADGSAFDSNSLLRTVASRHRRLLGASQPYRGLGRAHRRGIFLLL